MCLSFNPSANVRCDAYVFIFSKNRILVSIRTPTQGAMATHSKIRPFQVSSTPHSPQNRRILGNPFQRTHPCNRPLREKTCRFYVHLGFALELSFGASHHYLCRGCKFSIVKHQTTFFWSTPSSNQATSSNLPHNQSHHQTFPLTYQQNIIYRECNTY